MVEKKSTGLMPSISSNDELEFQILLDSLNITDDSEIYKNLNDGNL